MNGNPSAPARPPMTGSAAILFGEALSEAQYVTRHPLSAILDRVIFMTGEDATDAELLEAARMYPRYKWGGEE